MNKAKKSTLVHSGTAAVFSAITCIISQFSVITPTGVPFTLQTLAITLCGYLLGLKWGTVSVITYILLGAVGIPVFSGFRGGIQHIVGASGGFILGFILLSLACGFSLTKPKWQQLLFGITGVILCHLCGIIQLSVVSGISVTEAFITGSLPFILKDIICIFLGLYFANTVKRKVDFL